MCHNALPISHHPPGLPKGCDNSKSSVRFNTDIGSLAVCSVPTSPQRVTAPSERDHPRQLSVTSRRPPPFRASGNNRFVEAQQWMLIIMVLKSQQSQR
ncbi:uncharacterized [Tachysurus ichikawai]